MKNTLILVIVNTSYTSISLFRWLGMKMNIDVYGSEIMDTHSVDENVK